MRHRYSRQTVLLLCGLLTLPVSLHVSSQPLPRGLAVKRIVALDYPPFARFGNIQGRVELVATVSGDGAVTGARVISGAPPLGEPAKQMLMRWLFEPCEPADGRCETRIVFQFTLEGMCDPATHCPSEFQVDLPDRVTVKAALFRAILN